MVAYAFNPSTWEAEAGGSLWVHGQPHLFPAQSGPHKINLVSKKKKKKAFKILKFPLLVYLILFN
jgi:hypothetical protein